jgi:hypothetical protein
MLSVIAVYEVHIALENFKASTEVLQVQENGGDLNGRAVLTN